MRPSPHRRLTLLLTGRLTRRVGPPEKGVEKENRGVRVRGLDPSTQEAIIQQEFEKLAPVRRVNYIAGSTEAVVLLENPAVRGVRPLSSSCAH